jgi:hypothetical protein
MYELTITNGEIRINNDTRETKSIARIIDERGKLGGHDRIYIEMSGASDFMIEPGLITLYNGSTTIPDFDTVLNDIRQAHDLSKFATLISSVALEASHVLATTKGKLFSLIIYNDKASAQYYQLHDAAALPSNGTVPILTVQVATKATLAINTPIPFVNGLVVANSSTGATLTIGSADSWFTAQVA